MTTDNQNDNTSAQAATTLPIYSSSSDNNNTTSTTTNNSGDSSSTDSGVTNSSNTIPVDSNKQLDNPSVIQEAEVYSVLDSKSNDDVVISLPPDTQTNINTALESMPNVNIEDTTTGSEWIERLRAAQLVVPQQEWLVNTVNREGSQFKQSVQSEKGKLTAGTLGLNDNSTKLTGERAVLRVRALTGLGSVIMVPLWHSGFWITLKAPTEAAMLELDRRLAEEKVTLGRSTYGLAYANTSVIFAGWLVDFALSHVYDTSLKVEASDDIRSRISQLDVPLLIWGLACTIWPTGFPYAKAVLDQTKEQNKIIREKINIGKILWVDNAALTPWQISHMAQRHGNTMTLDSLERYHNEFIRGKGRTIKLSDDLSINLRVPNVNQYLTSGEKWVGNIITMVDKAFSMPSNEKMRDSYIMDQGKATNMRQFGHFVESLEVTGDIIDDVETLEQTLDVLSSNDEYRTIYFSEIRKFIEDSTMAIVATPVTEENEVSELPRFPHLIPLDVMSVFFIQLTIKTMQIQTRY